MTQRNVAEGTYALAYDAENHLVEVTGVVTATYLYNGDGTRVAATLGVTTTVYVGNYFEWDVSAGEMTKYYYVVAQRIAMREGSGEPKWLLGALRACINKRLAHAPALEPMHGPGGWFDAFC